MFRNSSKENINPPSPSKTAFKTHQSNKTGTNKDKIIGQLKEKIK
jgi:hypothetical protein